MASIGVSVIGWLVSPIISKVIDHGILHFKEKWKLEKGVPEEIERLSKVFRLVRGVLEDAEKKQSENTGVLSWLGELKEALYDAEDVLDAYEVDLALMGERTDGEQKLPTATGWKAKVSGHFSSCLCCRISAVAKQIKSIREKLDDICDRGQRLGLQQIAISASAPENNTRGLKNRNTASFLEDEATVVGREDEKKAIKKMLLDDLNDSGKKLLVIPIVGMGGVGKTTLARLVFNDKDVKDSFKSKAWVCIGMSRDLDLESLMKKIITSVGRTTQTRGMNYENSTLDSLQKTLVEEIGDEQPLLMVVDDAWDSKVSSWKGFLDLFNTSGLTCRIIVTTRNREVADAIRSDRLEPVPIKFLEKDDMWNILRTHAFPRGTVDINRELEFVGRQIVERLKGLPLAAEVIGGVLYGNTEARYWRSILDNKLLEINEKDGMLPILMLSYDNLPADLKQCFSYISLFPKDYKFVFGPLRYPSSDSMAPVYLISYLWMSQKSSNIEKGKTPEDTGTEIINHLSNKSLLQAIRISFGPSITFHDLVHDLAEKITKEEFLCVSGVTGNINLPKKLRHISFHQENTDAEEISELELKILKDVKERQTLRTLLLHMFDKKFNNYTRFLDDCFTSLIHLRALSLHNGYIKSLPDSIGNLKLLRYLDLNLPFMEELPNSVSRLYNLQVLVLTCVRLSALNDSLTALVNLVQLDHKSMKTLKSIGKLTNLQQLEGFEVKREEGHKVKELGELNKIFGSLHILNLENVEAKEEAEGARLHEKDGLTALKFEWGATSGQEELQSDVLEGLRPNENLTDLSLSGYMGTRLPTWLNDECLPLLKDITLHKCSNLLVIPTLTSSLRWLTIDNSPRLKELPSLPPELRFLSLSHVGLTSMLPSSSSSSQPPPSAPRLTLLSSLHVRYCPDLDESLGELLNGSLPSLGSLDIFDCSRPLEAIRCLTALSSLRLFECHKEVGIHVRTLISLTFVMIEDCPSATIEDPHPDSSAPCTSLSYLSIRRSPKILKSLSRSSVSLSSLKKLLIFEDDVNGHELSRCLYGLASLEELTMEDCPVITSIQKEALGTLVSLKTLSISSCERLEDLDLPALRSLKSLRITACPGFVFDDHPRARASSDWLLEDVEVNDSSAEQLAGLLSLLGHCSNVKSIVLRNEKMAASGLGGICMLPTLERLDVTGCGGLPSRFPPLGLLRELRIQCCSDAMAFPALGSLQLLILYSCPNFTFSELPPAPFPSLLHLEIFGISLQELTHLIKGVARVPLWYLHIGGCNDLMRFDGELERSFLSLTSLRHLMITGCDHLQQLPSDLRGFKALTGLIIEGCSQISSLPEEGLPVVLETLSMAGCPALEARYGGGDGNPHRQRISHIPRIEI